jgi:hypothetical protein
MKCRRCYYTIMIERHGNYASLASRPPDFRRKCKPAECSRYLVGGIWRSASTPGRRRFGPSITQALVRSHSCYRCPRGFHPASSVLEIGWHHSFNATAPLFVDSTYAQWGVRRSPRRLPVTPSLLELSLHRTTGSHAVAYTPRPRRCLDIEPPTNIYSFPLASIATSISRGPLVSTSFSPALMSPKPASSDDAPKLLHHIGLLRR